VTEKNLAYYLQNPGEAHKIPESELRSWLDQYPYSSGVRWLKARKDLHTSNPNVEDSISKAATYANDLYFLRYQLLRNTENEAEMVRQLKSYKPPVEEEPIKVAEIKTTPVAKVSEPPKEVSKPTAEEKNPSVQEKKSQPVKKVVVAKKAKDVKKVDLVKKEEKANKTEEAKPAKSKSKKATPKSGSQVSNKKEESKETAKKHAEIVDQVLKQEEEKLSDFTNWLLSLNQSEGQPKEKSSKKKTNQPKASKKKKDQKGSKKSKKKGKKSRLKKLIDQSLAAQDEAVSETYADLLAAQGYTDRAMELYQKLMFIYPEKSGYFAAKIENLEKS